MEHNNLEPVRLSRGGIRKGRRLNLEKKRSITRMTREQIQDYGFKTDTSSLHIANLRHRGHWWCAQIPIHNIKNLEIVGESFNLGVMTLRHRYLRFTFEPQQPVELRRFDEDDKIVTFSTDQILFSPEGVAGTDKIQFFRSLFPYYSVAYCFRSGEYLHDRAGRTKVEAVSLGASKQQVHKILEACIARAIYRRNVETARFFKHNCTTIIYSELLTHLRENSQQFMKQKTFFWHLKLLLRQDIKNLHKLDLPIAQNSQMQAI